MISKKKAIAIGLVLVLLTAAGTFLLDNMVQLTVGSKVIIPKNQLDNANKVAYLKEYIDQNYLNKVTEKEMLDGQIKGLFQSLDDPYSVYMTKDEFSDFMDQTEGSYGGVGIIVTPGEDNYITVVSPIEDTPGEKAGIKPGDKIIKVDDKEFLAEEMDKAVDVMKGKPGTDVDLTIIREEEELTLTLTREEIRLVSVNSRMLEGNIGYIRIIQFDELVYDDFKKHLSELQDSGMKSLIIDLRNNPGGLLQQTADIADLLIGESPIVYTETKNGEKEYYNSDKDKLDIPLVLLVNEGSASASEILAGAVKDTNSGTILGTTTFGKGIVQRIEQLSDGSGFKLTISEYFTPNGINIHGKGIKPDIEVELPENVEWGVENIEEDIQLNKAIEVLKEKM
ncbi:S41 family peptidase [Clostridium sp. D2Q-14]|uniref:S41 family peptidase n=1 Tax=Anaeromonas gelatinilytica TaxID=2683194 RepID=UPI00193B1BF5|nr:S41 family peptidase [Anaeromonas gelatinilytica]MBS4534809.1 S41 family peptidase [Anaeromonas gelatinilytica]